MEELLDGLEGAERAARLTLIQRLLDDGCTREELRAANDGPLMIMSTVPSAIPWLMSVSLPSDDAGNTSMSNLPLVRFLISAAAQTDSV